ncbi:MAG: DUF4962 domain-containing protein [Planctomycetota bacterium]|jgi:hypothetical protein
MAGTLQPVTLDRPRIHFTAGQLETLKERARSTHARYYSILLETADGFARRRPPARIGTSDNDRIWGDMPPVLAMAFLLSGEKRYLSAARRVVERILEMERWGDGLNLVTGHYMSGVAIAYDWLHPHLPAALLGRIEAALAAHAERIIEYAVSERIWWHDMFLQNWSHVIIGGLAYAGAALYGKIEGAQEWIDFADDYFTGVKRALPDDGSYQEGQAYLTYALEMLVRYWDLAKGLFGRDHFDCKWMKEVPYQFIYFGTPDPRPRDNCMVFGDGPRHFEWHGPVHLLHRLADEYGDAVTQGFAARLARAGIGLTRGGAWGNMLWFNPDLGEKGVEHLPALRFFEDMDTVTMRSGWDADAVMVGFKCTNNMLRKSARLYPGRDLGSGHAQPDAGAFQVYAFGQWLAPAPGYTHYKRSADHNTFLINGVEQLGGDRTWFDVMETQGGPCEITKVVSKDAFDYARADASGIYRPRARLERFIRHLIFIKPCDVLIVDELAAAVNSRFQWRLHADDEILSIGDQFHVRKNEARMRVLFLAPEDLAAKITSHRVEGATHSTARRTVLLSAQPRRKTREALFATLLSVYRGEAPARVVESFAVENGVVRVKLAGEDGSRELSLDLAKEAVRVR